jgi:hypothetical protein
LKQLKIFMENKSDPKVKSVKGQTALDIGENEFI